MDTPILQKNIYEVHVHQIILDHDLAKLYEVPTKSLNLAVKRNMHRFSSDFML